MKSNFKTTKYLHRMAKGLAVVALAMLAWRYAYLDWYVGHELDEVEVVFWNHVGMAFGFAGLLLGMLILVELVEWRISIGEKMEELAASIKKDSKPMEGLKDEDLKPMKTKSVHTVTGFSPAPKEYFEQ